MIRSIITTTAVISQQSEPVTDLTKAKEVINDMIDTAKYLASVSPGCIGLAAIQINEPYRIIIIWHSGRWIPMINPVILKAWGGKDHKYEGCLSRPGKDVRVPRHKKIRVSFMDYSDPEKTIEQRYTGMAARVIAHECDHLNGVFI